MYALLRAGGYGFQQPNPEIQFARVAAATCFRKRVNCNFSQPKLLGARSWRIFDPAFDTVRRVFDGQWHRWLCVHFFVDANDNRNALYFNHDVDKRNLNNVWLNPDEQWNDNWWFLVLATSATCDYSAAFSAAEVVRDSMFRIHPPSIRPISSSGSESAVYFFVSMSFISHAMRKKNLSVSVFATAFWMNGSFLSFGKYPAVKTSSRISTNVASIFLPSVCRDFFGK